MPLVATAFAIGLLIGTFGAASAFIGGAFAIVLVALLALLMGSSLLPLALSLLSALLFYNLGLTLGLAVRAAVHPGPTR